MSDSAPQPESEVNSVSDSTQIPIAVETGAPLSKKAQKRAAKTARIAAQKAGRRAREKEARKEKKQEMNKASRKRDDGDGDGDGEEDGGIPRKRARTVDPNYTGPAIKFRARLVIDLGFDDKMTDKEIVSLTSQLAYTYSVNRKAARPFEHLLFTSLDGRTYARLESLSNAGYKRWTGTEWWADSYESLWKEREDKSDGEPNTPAAQFELPIDRQSVVYLTADSSEELTELKEGETYIIGGICDHNRYKNLCQDKAMATGIRSARLPIGTYLAQLPTRKVLTVNQVVEILLKWAETRDWENSLYSVMPKRKFQQGKSRDNGVHEGDHEESEVIVVNEAGIIADAL